MSTSAGPNIVEDGLVLCLDSANEKSFTPYNNILDTSTWTIGTGSVTGFSRNGADAENHRIFDTDPWGNTNIVWEARPEAASGADGGWNGSNFNVDQSKMYRFSVWVRRTVKGNGHFYLGTRGMNSAGSNIGIKRRSSTSTTTNPYFEVNANWNEWPGETSGGSTWYLVVAHVWPFGSGEGSNHADSGIYKQDGALVDTLEHDYVWIDGTFKSMLRTYLYYSTDTTTRQQWIYPRVDVIDGTEPSIQDLLDNKPNISYDLTDNANDGSLLNNVSFNDANNGSFVFDGVDDYILCGRVPYTGTSTSSVSWEIWVCPQSTSGNIMSMSSTNPQGSWNMPPISAVSQKFTGKIWSNTRLQDTSAYNLNQWYQVVLVWDYPNTTQTLYVNGEQKASQSGISYSASGTDNYLFFGQQNPDADDAGMFQGKYGQINVYGNKALTGSEVKQNFNALRGRYGI